MEIICSSRQISALFYWLLTGITRDPTCQLIKSYQAYVCHDWDYQMLQIESMDADTESRRISPVAIYGKDGNGTG